MTHHYVTCILPPSWKAWTLILHVCRIIWGLETMHVVCQCTAPPRLPLTSSLVALSTVACHKLREWLVGSPASPSQLNLELSLQWTYPCMGGGTSWTIGSWWTTKLRYPIMCSEFGWEGQLSPSLPTPTKCACACCACMHHDWWLPGLTSFSLVFGVIARLNKLRLFLSLQLPMTTQP